MTPEILSERPRIEVICGDCWEYMKQIPDKSISLVLTDPPYNVDKDFLNDNLSKENFRIFIKNFIDESLRVSDLLLFFTGSKYLLEVMGGVSQFKDVCYFYKPYANNRGIITKWNFCDMIIVCGKMKKQKPKNNFYQYLKFPTLDGKPHPCPKPLEIMRKLVIDFSETVNTILDPFMGSGTTGVACKELNRNFIGIEIEPKYYEIAKRRINNAQTDMFLLGEK